MSYKVDGVPETYTVTRLHVAPKALNRINGWN